MRIKLAFVLLFAASAWGQTALMPMPRQCFLDSLSAGRPLAGGKIFSYQSGSSTPQATFTDSTGLTQNTNPVILDAAGCSSIWLTAGLAYRFVAQNSFGVQEWLTDSVSGLQTSSSTFASAYTTVTFSSTPTFTATGQFQVFKITLAGNVTSSSLSMGGVTVPSLVTFQITQDSTGGRTFVWPLNVASTAGPVPPLNLAANSTTTQSLFWDGTTAWALSNAFQPGPNVINASAYATLNAAIAACSSGTIQVTATVQLTASAASTCLLDVAKGGIVNLASGQVLTLAPGILAGAYQIFTGSGTVAGLTTAVPEWWGNVGTCTTGGCPQLSTAAAALTSGGVVQLRRSIYRSGFESSGTKVANTGIWLKGSGMPQYNGTYTQMVAGSGTIIQGKVAAEADSFEMTDLGIDVGSVVDAALLSSVPTDAFGINNDGQVLATPPSKNPVFINISTLGQNAAAAVHGFLMENVTGGYAENIHTVFNTHGFVLKGDHTTVNGLYSIGHNTDCLIIKSDDYAPTNNDSLTNIHCDVVNAGDTASGIVINPQAAVMSNVSISAVTIGGTGGISDAINLQLNNTSDHISISGVSIKGGTKQSVCLHVQGTTPGTAYTISNLNCDNYNYLVFQSQLLSSSTLSGFTGTNIGTGGNVGMLLEGIGEEVTNLVNSGTFVTGFSVDCATCTVYLNSWALPGFAGTNWVTSGGGQIFPGFGSPYMISPNGFFSGGVTTTASVTLGTVTPVATGTVASAQAMVVRDNTNGGAAIIVNDANGGPVIIGSIGTTVFVTGAPGATQVQVTNVAGQIKLLGGASRNNAVIAFAQLGN